VTSLRSPSLAYAWFVVTVLALANALSFIDRLILSLLVQPIKADLHLSDTQFGLLAGLAFALFYAAMGLVIARWADRYNRKWIVTTGIALWCAMTAITSTARSYLQLFAYRTGVGVGEATLSPSAYSLLAGYFPPNRLALAIGIFSAGVTAGTGIAFILGGALIQWVFAQDTLQLPVFGAVGGWRLVVALVGLLGLPVAGLMLLVREPPRAPGFAAAPLSEVWRHLTSDWRRYLLVFIGYGTTSITAFSVMTWTPALYMRQYHASLGSAAATIGIVALIGGVLGGWSGGAYADRRERRGDANAKLRVLAWCGIGLLLPSVLAPLMPTIRGHAALIFFTFFFGSAATGPAGSYVQSITPDRMRAQFGALYQLSLTLFGATIGPYAVGALNDQVFHSEFALGHSMALVSGIANPIAAFVLWQAFKAGRARLSVANS
jgi:MFS family permease